MASDHKMPSNKRCRICRVQRTGRRRETSSLLRNSQVSLHHRKWGGERRRKRTVNPEWALSPDLPFLCTLQTVLLFRPFPAIHVCVCYAVMALMANRAMLIAKCKPRALFTRIASNHHECGGEFSLPWPTLHWHSLLSPDHVAPSGSLVHLSLPSGGFSGHQYFTAEVLLYKYFYTLNLVSWIIFSWENWKH